MSSIIYNELSFVVRVLIETGFGYRRHLFSNRAKVGQICKGFISRMHGCPLIVSWFIGELLQSSNICGAQSIQTPSIFTAFALKRSKTKGSSKDMDPDQCRHESDVRNLFSTLNCTSEPIRMTDGAPEDRSARDLRAHSVRRHKKTPHLDPEHHATILVAQTSSCINGVSSHSRDFRSGDQNAQRYIVDFVGYCSNNDRYSV